MVGDAVKGLQGLEHAEQLFLVHAQLFGDLDPALQDVLLVHVHQAAELGVLGEELVVDLDSRFFLHLGDDRAKGDLIGSGHGVGEPGKPFQAGAHVNDLGFQLLELSSPQILELHEDAVAQLDAVDKVLDAGAEGAATGPDLFLEDDFLGLGAQNLGHQVEVVL